MWGNAYRATTVCVDTYHHRVLSGRLYNPALPAEGLRFESLVEFLLAMEDLLNETHFPQSFTAVRSFRTSSQRAAVPAGEQTATGRLATFTVSVLFRQNTSWQGSVSWLETGREESFRSVLELVLLMNSALETSGESLRGTRPGSSYRRGGGGQDRTAKSVR